MSKIEDLARAYGQGRCTAAEVIAAAKAGDAGYDYAPADTYDEMAIRAETDESAPFDEDGWDGVTAVYVEDGLTDAQYADLRALYVK